MKYLSIIAVAMMTVMGAQTISAQVDNRQKVNVSDAVKVANIMSVSHKLGCNHGVPYADSEGNFTGGKVYSHSGGYAFVEGDLLIDTGHSEVHGSTSSTRGGFRAGLGVEYSKANWAVAPFGEVYAGGAIGDSFAAMAGARAGIWLFPHSNFRLGAFGDVHYIHQKDQVELMDFESNKIVAGAGIYADIHVGNRKVTKWSDGYPVEGYRPNKIRLSVSVNFDRIDQPHDENVGPTLRKWNNTSIMLGVAWVFGSIF